MPPYSAATWASGITSFQPCGVRFIAMVKVREFEAATMSVPSPLRFATTFAIATAPLPPGMFVTYIVGLSAPVFCRTPEVVRQMVSQPPPGFAGAMHSALSGEKAADAGEATASRPVAKAATRVFRRAEAE